MNISFTPTAWKQSLFWQQEDKRTLKRIRALLTDMQRNPFEGTGKPEPLNHELSGLWSRRITDEHRTVYQVEGDTLIIFQCRYHS